MSRVAGSLSPAGAPLWTSPFRPFYLLGALYALALAPAWLGAWLGLWSVPPAGVPLALWHGHEMLFGFAAAIVVGITLTALPSWPGTAEVRGARLALLVALWAAGRIALWSGPWLAPSWRAAIDALFFPAVFVAVAPQLLRTPNRLYLLLLPVLAALAGANLAWHAGAIAADAALAARGLRAGVYALIVLFVLKGGVLTPIFTGNALRERGRGDQARFVMALDAPAVAAVVVLAALDVGGAPPRWSGAAALACLVLHGWRVARWRGWRVADVPLVFVMHLGFGWLLFAFALKAAADLAGLVPEAAWIHAFTVGALGMMMLGLMTRVVLRHTGRPLDVPRPMIAAWGAMFAAALLRLAATAHGLGHWAVAAAALLWVAPFAVYLALFARMLVAPSLPRAPRSIEDRLGQEPA
ncbi:MAG: NnrS family protein [Burkholderiaceae bacterium]|nr:NnrS family protein [Burkholderiaceae bacterium]